MCLDRVNGHNHVRVWMLVVSRLVAWRITREMEQSKGKPRFEWGVFASHNSNLYFFISHTPSNANIHAVTHTPLSSQVRARPSYLLGDLVYRCLFVLFHAYPLYIPPHQTNLNGVLELERLSYVSWKADQPSLVDGGPKSLWNGVLISNLCLSC